MKHYIVIYYDTYGYILGIRIDAYNIMDAVSTMIQQYNIDENDIFSITED